MIAESSILGGSSWASDQTLFFNGLDLADSCLYDDCENFNFNNIELEFPLTSGGSSGSVADYDSLGNSSHAPSAASSDCGDDFLVEIGSSDMNLINWINESCFESSLSDMLGNNLTDDLPLSTPDWNLIEDFPPSDLQTSNVNATPNIPSPQVRRHNKNLDPFTIRSWSDLSSVDQVEAAEALSDVISNKLGLREQLDVIRIIDPSAVISTSDTQFTIDLNCLNNAKWSAVLDYVKRVKLNSSTSNMSKKGNSRPSGNVGSQSNIPKPPKLNRRSEEIHNRNHMNETKRKYTKKANKEYQMEMKAFRQRQKKTQNQRLKERRSGLFAREEVVSLSTSPLEEDIDILE